MNEAKYSANVRANLKGYDVQITARSDGEDDLLEILTTMVGELERIGAMPERRWENGKGNGNGHADAAAVPSQPAAAAKVQPRPEPKPQPGRQPLVCQSCGSTNVHIITWQDKTTGQRRQAPKCQDCSTWQRD